MVRGVGAGVGAGNGGIVRVGSRRWFLQLGAAGLAGASAGSMLAPGSIAAAAGEQSLATTLGSAAGDRKAVILFWLSGGPSHIDMWDPKPDAPSEIRGPLLADRHIRCRACSSANTCRCKRRSWTSSR